MGDNCWCVSSCWVGGGGGLFHAHCHSCAYFGFTIKVWLHTSSAAVVLVRSMEDTKVLCTSSSMNPNKIPTAALLHKWNPAFNLFFYVSSSCGRQCCWHGLLAKSYPCIFFFSGSGSSLETSAGAGPKMAAGYWDQPRKVHQDRQEHGHFFAYHRNHQFSQEPKVVKSVSAFACDSSTSHFEVAVFDKW